ncbi:hypothetical protein BU15DRAFT_82680 [Melanogaster broomeanus]|nr:hypothetical protein BU15DRAFT_82680 [Melanogaster broomeanus]
MFTSKPASLLRLSSLASGERLQHHKFELERLEQSYRKEHLQTHLQSTIKKRSPAILNLVATYNKMCDDLRTMIRRRKAPRTAVPPLPIQRDNLFKLDVDDTIWQDVGLEDEFLEPPNVVG